MHMVQENKNQLRVSMLAKLLALAQEEIQRRSDNVVSRLSNLPVFQTAKVIMAYCPLKGEVDVWGLIRKAFGNKRFCFPVTDVQRKRLRIFEPADCDGGFVRGAYGVMEPDTGKSRELHIEDIHMVIVPGVAFDYNRNRLGRGGGFYDRFLARLLPSTATVGVAFDFQLLESLPINSAFDRTLDAVVSESRVI